MAKKRSKRVTRFRDVQADPCPGDSGLILSVGPMSLWLDNDTARQVVVAIEAAMTRTVVPKIIRHAARNTRESN
jgi:hypothetical protein